MYYQQITGNSYQQITSNRRENGLEDTIEEIDTPVKENYIYIWTFLAQRTWTCLQQNHRRKVPQPKERDGHKGRKSL